VEPMENGPLHRTDSRTPRVSYASIFGPVPLHLRDNDVGDRCVVTEL
jgi:hypothetical protein